MNARVLARAAVSAVATIVLTCMANPTEAARGVVVYKKSRCDYYIVNSVQGYALLEWYGGSDPDEGNVIGGDFESYGMKDIYNITQDSETTVWVEDFWLSRTRVIEKYRQKCRLD